MSDYQTFVTIAVDSAIDHVCALILATLQRIDLRHGSQPLQQEGFLPPQLMGRDVKTNGVITTPKAVVEIRENLPQLLLKLSLPKGSSTTQLIQSLETSSLLGP